MINKPIEIDVVEREAYIAAPQEVVYAYFTDPAKMVQVFSNALKIDGATLQIVLLNDRTVEALFPQSPAKAALRTKGRMTTTAVSI